MVLCNLYKIIKNIIKNFIFFIELGNITKKCFKKVINRTKYFMFIICLLSILFLNNESWKMVLCNLYKIIIKKKYKKFHFFIGLVNIIRNV